MTYRWTPTEAELDAAVIVLVDEQVEKPCQLRGDFVRELARDVIVAAHNAPIRPEPESATDTLERLDHKLEDFDDRIDEASIEEEY